MAVAARFALCVVPCSQTRRPCPPRLRLISSALIRGVDYTFFAPKGEVAERRGRRGEGEKGGERWGDFGSEMWRYLHDALPPRSLSAPGVSPLLSSPLKLPLPFTPRRRWSIRPEPTEARSEKRGGAWEGWARRSKRGSRSRGAPRVHALAGTFCVGVRAPFPPFSPLVSLFSPPPHPHALHSSSSLAQGKRRRNGCAQRGRGAGGSDAFPSRGRAVLSFTCMRGSDPGMPTCSTRSAQPTRARGRFAHVSPFEAPFREASRPPFPHLFPHSFRLAVAKRCRDIPGRRV